MPFQESMRKFAAALDAIRPYRVFDRPIFILSAPRSGSTHLFELISRFKDVWCWHAELDDLWWELFPYERNVASGDFVSAEEYTPQLGRQIRRGHYRFARWAREERGILCGLTEHFGGRSIRFLDKTIANCFHLEILEQTFPDAIYLFLVRDPRATISSMIEGWCDPLRFSKPHLQPWIDPARSTIPHWSYPAPQGWQEWTHRPLEEICAWSCMQHSLTVANFLQSVPRERWLQIKYEQLHLHTEDLAATIESFCGLELTPSVRHFLQAKPLSRTTVSAPDPEKWRRLHGEKIESIQRLIEPLMQRLEYSND